MGSKEACDGLINPNLDIHADLVDGDSPEFTKTVIYHRLVMEFRTEDLSAL